MKCFLWLFCLSIFSVEIFAQEPEVSSGQIERIKSFPSTFVEARNVDIWLPEGYNRKKKYAVLYMHDGQMLFDSTTTWNRKAWEVDDVAAKLMNEKKVKDFIVVGIWNGGPKRHAEYFPQKPFESLSQSVQDKLYGANRSNGDGVFKGIKVQSDKYLLFIVKELKPYIDKKYSTNKDPANTIIAGSSMGGLISIYALCEYPSIFGGAACMSTHWPGIFYMENNPVPEAFYTYLETHLPDSKTHKLYFDHGTATLDAMYPPLQKKVDEILKVKGYDESNWMTKVFPGEDHSETAWQKRLYIPLTFLLYYQQK
jgi:enterochelin esterase-like enzyme